MRIAKKGRNLVIGVWIPGWVVKAITYESPTLRRIGKWWDYQTTFSWSRILILLLASIGLVVIVVTVLVGVMIMWEMVQ